MKTNSKIAIWWSVPWMIIGTMLFWIIGIPLRGLYMGWIIGRGGIDEGLADKLEEKK